MLRQLTRLDSLLERVGPVNGDLELSGIDQVCDGARSSALGTAGPCPLAWAKYVDVPPGTRVTQKRPTVLHGWSVQDCATFFFFEPALLTTCS